MTNHSDNMIRDFLFSDFCFLICELMLFPLPPTPPLQESNCECQRYECRGKGKGMK